MNSMKKRQQRSMLTALLFVLPFFVLFTVFIVWPIIQGFWVSLNKWSLMGRQSFVGLANFEKLLNDSKFWSSLRNTCLFVLITAPLVTVISLILAVFANRETGYKKFLRISYYLPGILSVAVASSLAKYSFSPYQGLINGILKWAGTCDTTTEPLWFNKPVLAWTVIVVMTIWWTLGFPMLLYLSALQDIPRELKEAAAMDGANDRQYFFHITLPLLKTTASLVALLQVIACFKVFGQIRLITAGGPANSTRPLIQYIYEQAFDKNNLGYSAAMSYVLFAILIICTLIQMKVQKVVSNKL